MKIFCQTCARQIVNYSVSDKTCVGGKPVVCWSPGYICHECFEDLKQGGWLDENGLLPEER